MNSSYQPSLTEATQPGSVQPLQLSKTLSLHLDSWITVKDSPPTLRKTTLHLTMIIFWILPLKWFPNCYIQKSQPHF